MTDDVEIWVVAGQFQARSGREAELGAVLAHYVVLTRGVAGCRNVDLVALGQHAGQVPRDREVGRPRRPAGPPRRPGDGRHGHRGDARC